MKLRSLIEKSNMLWLARGLRARFWTARDYRTFHLYSSILSESDLFFDIGANMGHRTKVALRLDAKVIAVEPQARCANILKKLYGKSVTVVQQPIHHKNCPITLHESTNHTLSTTSEEWLSAVKSTRRFPREKWSTTYPIQATTLSNLIATYGTPRFVKIDVEGSEYNVIRNLAIPIDYIAYEYTPELPEIALASLKHIANLGEYRFNYACGETMQLERNEWLDANAMSRLLHEQIFKQRATGDIYCKISKLSFPK